MMQLGDTGTAVNTLQTQLNAWGYGLTVDGSFGPNTERAVMSFQSKNALTVDGIVGPATQAALSPNALPPTVAALSALPVSTSGSELSGVDIYHLDTVTSWSALASVCQFICVKATQGASSQDPHYTKNIDSARAAGMIVGSYHFIDLAADGVAQADNFLSMVKPGFVQGDWLALDWETANGDPHSVSGDPIVIQAFLERVKSVLGQRCFIYASHALTNETGNPGFLAEYPLWLVDYSGHARVPAPWKTWNIWQTSGSASIHGLAGTGDLDTFQGDMSELKALIAYCKV